MIIYVQSAPYWVAGPDGYPIGKFVSGTWNQENEIIRKIKEIKWPEHIHSSLTIHIVHGPREIDRLSIYCDTPDLKLEEFARLAISNKLPELKVVIEDIEDIERVHKS